LPLIVDDVIEVVLKSTMAGRTANNVTHWRCARPIDGDSTSVARRVLDAFQEHLVANASSALSVVGADYTDLDSLEGDTGSIGPNAALPLSGISGPDAHPPNTAVLIRKVTEGGRASGSGRMFIMGVREGDADNAGTLSAGRHQNWQDGAQLFLEDANREANGSSAINMCVVRRPLGGVGSGTSFDVQSLSVSAVLATQRERMRR
jgi:hypothetical protein